MEREDGVLDTVEGSASAELPALVLLVSLGVFAACGIAYELILATISSYLFGDSIYFFSLTIGLFLSAMGLGAWLSQKIHEGLLSRFLWLELALALVGGLAPGVLLFLGVSEGLAIYSPVLVVLTLMIGGLVGVELPLLMRIVRQSQTSLRSTLAYALAADYAGSLVGSLFFPLLLLPWFGLLAGGFVLGLLNVLTALVTALALRRYLRVRRSFVIAAVAVGLLLVGGIWKKGPLEVRFDALAFRDPLESRQRSAYQEIVLTQGQRPAPRKRVSAEREGQGSLEGRRRGEGQGRRRGDKEGADKPGLRELLEGGDPLAEVCLGEPCRQPTTRVAEGKVCLGGPCRQPTTRVAEGSERPKERGEDDPRGRRALLPRRWKDDLRMFLQGRLQFSSLDEYRYHEALVHPGMSLIEGAKAVLILGGGDGLALREVLRYKSVSRVEIVDLDAKVVEIARRHPQIRQLNEGAFEDMRVRVHIEDAFLLRRLPIKPVDLIVIDLPDPHAITLARLYSVEFYRLLRGFVRKGGLVVTQASSPFFARRSFWCVRTSLEEAGYTARSYRTNVHSFGEWGFHLASPTPRPLEPTKLTIPTRYLTEALLPTLFVWPRDQERVPIPSSTLLHPRIARFYQQDTWLGDTRRR